MINTDYLNYAQVIVSVVLIVLILLQQRGTALGSAFGQDGGSFYSTRRGIQKSIYWASVVFGALFIILSLINLAF
jgi:preprotein translocase subunit SecG